MLTKFNPHSHAIIVNVFIKATHPTIAKLILDTGASRLVLPWKLATTIGLSIDQDKITPITTVTTVESVPEVNIPEVTVLGKTVKNVKGVIKDLPPQAPADGLLGLSFLKHFRLTIDFRKGLLSLD